MCILKPASVGIVGTGGRHVGGWVSGRIRVLGELFSEARILFLFFAAGKVPGAGRKAR